MSIDILERRINRMKSVIAKRQYDLTVILENVHDPHNIGAVMRTCDSIGINEIFILYTEPRLQEGGLKIGLNSSSGAGQWVKVNYYECMEACFNEVKKRFNHIFGTAIGPESSDLYALDLTSSCALLFGNEHSGISTQAMQYVDQNFLIPQYGFVQSLNISVACAISLYEAARQRSLDNQYDRAFGDHPRDHNRLNDYIQIHQQKKLNKINNKKIF